MKPSNKDIEIYHRLNKLKMKAGGDIFEQSTGFLDAMGIRRAQQAIDAKATEYEREIEEVLVKLDSTWDDLKTCDPKQYKKILSKLYNFANNVKDLAETYNYRLMQHFGLSLREFSENLDASREEHRIIVQAHIDVMWVTFKEKIQDDGGPVAQELKKIVAAAIQKYG